MTTATPRLQRLVKNKSIVYLRISQFAWDLLKELDQAILDNLFNFGNYEL